MSTHVIIPMLLHKLPSSGVFFLLGEGFFDFRKFGEVAEESVVLIIQFFIIFVLVTVNILLGCYVMIQLGYGPPDWKTALNQVIDFSRWRDYWDAIRSRVPVLRRRYQKDDVPKTPVSETKTENADERTVSNDNENYEGIIRKLTEIQPSEFLEDESDKLSHPTPMKGTDGGELVSPLPEKDLESWLADEKYVETSLIKLNNVILKSGKFAAELDWRIRAFRGEMIQEDVRQFVEELREDCRNYLESQASITDQMKKRLDDFGELKNLAEAIDYANMEQSAQIETTLSNLDLVDLNRNPEESANRLIKELSSLRLVRHRLRDMQDRIFLQIVFTEKREERIPPQLYTDEQFGIRGRIGLEIALHEWWKQKRHENFQISFALLDFVKFGEINDEHGMTVCDKMIRLFGNSLKDHFDSLDLTGIYSGNCFMVAAVSTGPKKTITEIERIRQHCEKTIFQYNKGKNVIRLQLTCAVTEALASQSKNDVFTVLEKTLTAAKKNGRNHTFRYVPGPLDNPPEKIEAPNLGEEESIIEIA